MFICKVQFISRKYKRKKKKSLRFSKYEYASYTNYVTRAYCHSDIGQRQKQYSVRNKAYAQKEVVQTAN